ncbi:MAG: CpsD/CapB family tyrosine-protein kinase [Planctomycetia bacterium]|nr:CpsD/CapB family tyrosine-protein kinase [Planctomycetia bacterium]
MITLTQESAAALEPRRISGDPLSERYQALVQRLRAAGDLSVNVVKTLGVTSCASGAGATTMAANLAVAAAQIGQEPVLLVDLNIARPALAARFGMSRELGLHEALVEGQPPSDCVKPTPIANLSLLAADRAGDPDALRADRSRINHVLESLERDFGFIVVDLPATESSLCFATAGLLDAVLLVMEAERTRLESAVQAKERLLHAQANVLGVILNKRPQHIPDWLYQRL